MGEQLLFMELMVLKYLATFALSGLVVACLPLEPRFSGSNLAEDSGFLRVIKIHCKTSSEGK
jgi:hypothetical protein